MNKIYLGIISAFTLLFCVEAGAEDFDGFRKYRTTDYNITYTERTLQDGRVIFEVVLIEIHTDLQNHAVDAKKHTDVTETEETLFLTKAAKAELEAAIAASDQTKKEVLASWINDTKKVKDANGVVLTEITHITFANGVPQSPPSTSTAGSVVTKDNVRTTSVRYEFDTIVENSKPIVSQN